jgi:DNA polymerase-1
VKRTLLIDADIIAYKCSATSETVCYFDGRESEPAVEADLEEAKENAIDYIADLKANLSADEVVVCLTDRGNEFRKDLYPLYKAHRKGRKPANLLPLLDFFKTKYTTYLRPKLEADDCMGILATHPTLIKGEKIIVSEDKDMKSVPAMIYNPRIDAEPHKVSQLDADRFHLWQTIAGDTCDGYPGAPGVGPKSKEAQAVLASKSVGEAWTHVLKAYARVPAKKWEGKASLVNEFGAPRVPTPYELALTQARLARILRATDWDFAGKRPRLWTPPRVG